MVSFCKKFLMLLFFLLLIPTRITSAFLPPIVANQAMVTTSQALATKIGLDILKKGGNAVDAAVAIGYALAVVDPCCGNIGGGGFMLVHLHHGKNIFIDFREKAPAGIQSKDFFDANGKEKKDFTQSYLSVGVPGTVMGLNNALKRYGTLPLKTVMAPAIELAEHGFKLTSENLCLFHLKTERFAKEANVKEIFLKNGKPFAPGDVLIQKNLANTLRLISKDGEKAFYSGPIAKALVEASNLHHGLLSLNDLAHYQISITDTIHCNYRGYDIITSPPPASGATVCEILNIVSGYPLHDLGFHSALATHFNLEAMRYAYADRNRYLGDPAFISNPISTILSTTRAQKIRDGIKKNEATPSDTINRNAEIIDQEKPNTTSYNVIDQMGNAVVVTYTINGYFGSGVMASNTGFFLNNELADFSLKSGVANAFHLMEGKNNLIMGQKRPLSSMSPTIIMKNNHPFLLVGAAGGSTIITTIVQIIENVIDWNMDINAAVNAPRYHMQWLPDRVYTEPFAFSHDTEEKLQKMGYTLQLGSPFHTKFWGEANAILIDPNTNLLSGAFDNREPTGTVGGLRSEQQPTRICPSIQL